MLVTVKMLNTLSMSLVLVLTRQCVLMQGGAVIDDVWLIKAKHGAGTYNCV